MEKKNYNEIMTLLKEVYSHVTDFAYEDWGNIPDDFEPLGGELDWKIRTRRQENYFKHIGLGEMNVVASYGGEGKGEDWWKVFHFVDHDVYIRIDGYYQSYDGVNFYDGWDCCKEVKPVEKTITVYE